MNELTRQDGAAVAVQPQAVEMSLESLAMQMATNPSFDADKMASVLRELREARAETRKERFDEALRRCQMEMPRVSKGGKVMTKDGREIYSYAKLEDLDACIRPIYQKHGFTVMFDAPQAIEGGKIRNVARFSCAGHTESVEITAAASNRSAGSVTLTDAQKVKQTITECRRHLQEMFFNIITEGADDRVEEDAITQDQADDIRTRMNDLKQSAPGVLLKRLCEKHGVNRPEELRKSQYEQAIKDVEATEAMKR